MSEVKNDLRITRTYKMLSDAFSQLLEVKSFEEITVNELCEQAMIRRATFYKHFADKFEYLDFYLRELKEDFQRKVDTSVKPKSTQDYFLNMSYILFDYMDSHEKMVSHIISSNAFPLFLDILCEKIASDLIGLMQTNHDVSKQENISIELMAYHCAGGLLQLVKYWFLQRKKINKEELQATLFYIINHALAVE